MVDLGDKESSDRAWVLYCATNLKATVTGG